MKNFETFLKMNTGWFAIIISECVSEMVWDEGMIDCPSDFFHDTLYYAREKSEIYADEIKEYIESEVIKRLYIIETETLKTPINGNVNNVWYEDSENYYIKYYSFPNAEIYPKSTFTIEEAIYQSSHQWDSR